jgi:hypothetical protein
MHQELRAILTNARSYPLELTLANGETRRIPRRNCVHFPPRMKDIVYYPPRKSDGLLEFISPDRVIKVRTRCRKRAA